MAEIARSELSPTKRRQILEGARQAFAELGYERTSVDAVAARAGVSKATVYNHFGDKKGLYIATAMEEVEAMREGLRASLGAPEGDVEAALRQTGEKLMAVLVSPPIVALYRHTLADACRFPDVGRTWFERGPAATYDVVATYLGRWRDAGKLVLDDPRTAAIHFVQLCQGDVALRAHCGVIAAPARAEIRDAVRQGVKAFLRAYARP